MNRAVLLSAVFVTVLPVATRSVHIIEYRDEISTTRQVIVTTESFQRINATTEEPFQQINSTIKEPFQEAKHPCDRECKEGSVMTCRYQFKVEWYQTMSKACYECPFNVTHCSAYHCIPADGVKRPIVVVNRQFPGPPIEVCHGDIVEVEVENALMEEGTSIHWHGQYQRGTPFMDGVPFITQCPITPRSKFLYRFKADTPGTHFWHSHSALQRGDGMFGALIVRVPLRRDPQFDLFDFDLSEHVMVILDWAHTLGITKFTAHHHSDGDNKPTNLLINGKGRYQEFEDEFGNVLHTPVANFTVKQGFRYRFRIINAGYLNCPIQMSIDNHTIVVVSSDGSDLEPMEAESLVTYAGERFDIIVQMDQEIDNYWIRFRGLMDCDERFTSAHQVAILRYQGAEEIDPPSDVSYENSGRDGLQINSLNTGYGANDSMIIPELRAIAASRQDPSLKPVPDYKFYIAYDFYPLDNPDYHLGDHYGFDDVTDPMQKLYTPQFNHISMKLPPFPLMANLQESNKLDLCNSTSVDSDCDIKYCECTHVLRVPLNAVVELILIDKGFTYNANHPFHLHGYGFRVIGMDRLGTNVTVGEVKRLDEEGQLIRNLKDAPLKDTVTVPDGGYTVLRWKAINPGYWLFHCHIEYHVELGMAIVFKVGEDSDYPEPPPNFPQCNNYLPPPAQPTDKSILYKNYKNSEISEVDFQEINHNDLERHSRQHSFGKSEKSASYKASMSILLVLFYLFTLLF